MLQAAGVDLHDGAEDFFDGGEALGGFEEAVGAQTDHAVGLGGAGYLGGGDAVQYLVFYLFGDDHHPVDAEASPVARAAAPITPHGFVETKLFSL